MNRQQILQKLETAWQDFQHSYEGLSDAQMLTPGVTKAWSARDIVAHVTSWDEEALKHLPLVRQGQRPPRYSVTYGGIDAFNALTTARNKNLSLHEVRQQHAASHQRLIAYLETVPEDLFHTETRFRHRLKLDTYSHYPKHAAAIRKWRLNL
jgi:hypothetical protein